jgi:hypothetical protein
MSSRITIRLMAELPDEATALRFDKTVQTRVAAFGSVRQSKTKRYWKIPEWFEVNLYLQPNTVPSAAYDGILASLATGWERHEISHEEQWAVWNPKEGSSFFASQVRWANVELFPESCVVSE